MRDVVVVGAGHNALVAACYLARGGLDVEVVERRPVVGGAVSTVERFPGYRMDVGSSAHVMVRHTGIVEELALDDCGLVYHDLDPWGYAPFGDEALVFSVDLEATCASIEAVCGGRDADAYQRFVKDWAARNERVFEAFQQPPTGMALGRQLWGIGRGTGLGGLQLAREFLTSGDALLDAHFTDERLKTALAWLGAQSGPPPHEVATADLVGWNAMLHRRAPGHPRGGSGMLSEALAERLRRLGGSLRLGDAAARIAVRDGRAVGVETASGARVAARAVLAGCHVQATVDLVGDALAAGPAWQRIAAAVRRHVRVGNGIGMVVRLATTSLPRYPAGAGGGEWHGLQLIAPDRLALRRAYGEYLAGRPPTRPPVVAMTFSALDPTIAPPGRHNVTVWGQWHPYELADGARWDTIAAREGEKLVAAVDTAAPGFATAVEAMHVQTPLDLERELGLVNGQVMHVEMGLDQMFAWRPLPELAGYRTPLAGLYLTGASTHPGGGVFGASGRSAARVLLADAAGPRWRRLSRFVRSSRRAAGRRDARPERRPAL
jgi:phytoene dehydrogenase-like protein